jgi:proteic killer suppression protein
MIVEFSCKETEKVWNGEETRKWSARICKIALRKLFMLNAAHKLEDLRIPPSNRLHALKGKQKDHHSISINMQWRIIFIWNDGQVRVKITDYH